MSDIPVQEILLMMREELDHTKQRCIEAEAEVERLQSEKDSIHNDRGLVIAQSKNEIATLKAEVERLRDRIDARNLLGPKWGGERR